MVGPTEGLRFCAKVLQCACQGDAKRRGFTLVLFTGPGASRAAKPCLRQSCHPANSFEQIEISLYPTRFAIRYETLFE